MARNYFGTDGIRGPFGNPPLTTEFFFRLGKAAFDFFDRSPKSAEPTTLVIGRDTRSSGPILEDAFVNGFSRSGGQVIRLGVLPTASISANIPPHQADGGAMISASHNPHQDNGIKFFDASGFKLSNEAEEAFEQVIDHIQPESCTLPQPALHFDAIPEGKQHYFEVLRRSLPENFSLKGWRIFVDAAHGAAHETTPEFLRQLGATVELIGANPDGKNINHQCGSQHPEKAARAVAAFHNENQDEPVCGLCHDGDADRLLLIDENGATLDGDELLAICATSAARAGKLKGNGIVATVMSNLGLDECVRELGGTVVRTPVGDRYVLEAMQREKITIGGEQSGHTLFLDHLPTGDGLLTALQVFQASQSSSSSVASLKKCIRKYPQKLFNVTVSEKKPIEKIPEAARALRQVESELAETGRVFFRYSGTENKARLLIEARDIQNINPAAELILAPLRAAIGTH